MPKAKSTRMPPSNIRRRHISKAIRRTTRASSKNSYKFLVFCDKAPLAQARSRRLVHRERERREARPASAVPAARRRAQRRHSPGRTGRSPIASHCFRLGSTEGAARRQAHPCRRARLANIVSHGGQDRRRFHRPHVRSHQRHAARYARRRRARITKIAVVGRGKVKPRPRLKAATKAAQRTPIATQPSARMIEAKQSWSSIQAATGCSRATIRKIAKRRQASPAS
jgi:hypothetical protein